LRINAFDFEVVLTVGKDDLKTSILGEVNAIENIVRA